MVKSETSAPSVILQAKCHLPQNFRVGGGLKRLILLLLRGSDYYRGMGRKAQLAAVEGDLFLFNSDEVCRKRCLGNHIIGDGEGLSFRLVKVMDNHNKSTVVFLFCGRTHGSAPTNINKRLA